MIKNMILNKNVINNKLTIIKSKENWSRKK